MLVDWHVVKVIARAESPVARRLGLTTSLAVNLGLLAFFKYGGFAVESFARVAATLGIAYSPAVPDIVLPVGISFYTFQTLSYTLDVYRGVAKPWRSYLDFALYVTFFPQLVAGPIVRAVDFLPQCKTPRRATWPKLVWGLNLLLLGLFEKVVVADGLLAPIVEKVYAAADVTTVTAWAGTVAFAGQIFCDFAGYSTCAIGAAMCLGFALPDNFRFPYAAIGFSDFWRRWHVTLSTWLRDYLYIPLGGNRGGRWKTHRNLLLTMLIGGLWHGAAWTFVVWGGLHGLYLVGERWLVKRPIAEWAVWRSLVGRLFLAAVTFGLTCVAWTFFRAESLPQGLEMMRAMLVPQFGEPSNGIALLGSWDLLVTGGCVGTILLAHWMLRETSLEAAVSRVPVPVLAAANAAMLAAVLMMPGEDRAFLYFQF